MSRLIKAAAYLIDDSSIHLESPVICIRESCDEKILLITGGVEPKEILCDRVIACVPPAALQSIIERPQWSPQKEQAIRSIHYEPLYKLGLHFKSRKLPRAILGGQSTTDLRFRWIVYPSNNIGSGGSGVLLLYSWMTDALRWMSRSRKTRIQIALYDLDRYFRAITDQAGIAPIDISAEYLEAFDVHWSEDISCGDSLYLPGQFSRHFESARKNEGSVYFAGEHLSRHHTWIAGAIDSAAHAVRNLLHYDRLETLGPTTMSRPIARL